MGDFILDLLKITIPALIVFLTVYFLMKMHLKHQSEMVRHKMFVETNANTIPVQLQAYERLALFCERISLPNLILRLREHDMLSKDLKVALVFGLQKEYEHNISQQIYVSDQLWNIINIAKDNTFSVLQNASEKVAPGSNSMELVRAINAEIEGLEFSSAQKAQEAIRKEAALLLK